MSHQILTSAAHHLSPDDALLRRLVEVTATAVGEQFFRALVKQLALALPVGYAFVAEFAETNTRVRTLAYWGKEDFRANVEFNLPGTPCEFVLQGNFCHIPTGTAGRYPQDLGLVRLNADGYLGVPLVAEDGQVLGHLVVFDDQPMPDEPRFLSIFQIFAGRARVELERIRAEKALLESENRLAQILDSALDAIVTFDETQHIRLFNQAAEKVFRMAAADAIGKPVGLFLSAGLNQVVTEFVASCLESQKEATSLWLPDGLTALRESMEEFPLEGSLSVVRMAKQRLFTIILRDIDERKRAEAEIRKLQMENLYLQEELKAEYNFEEIVGASPAMEKIFQRIKQVAGTDATVLVIGETGTGKELIARAIHNRSKRKNRPLIKVNCAALSAGLIESEFFGHEKGAFTGAISQRIGRFELANGGTIFLDEIGEISLEVQAKLLRVLQEQEFERVGGSKTLRVDVRVIAATNRDLKKAVEENRFRADLYYRLNVFPLNLPPLRERTEDISLLVRYFVGKLSSRIGKRITRIDPRTMEGFLAYAWPGNIRELENVVERAVILADGPVLEYEDDAAIVPHAAGHKEMPLVPLEEMEKSYIVRVLEKTDWVIEGSKGAATILDMKPNTLRSRMQKLNIARPK
ncbi:MAG: sigma 54-interacting transcriptional regulator [Blastocatellia bacterium]|nr:sigma 54-interacting transcriptional regulator [Blastocatellia bacterium]